MEISTRRSSQRNIEAELDLPPGFRFHPTDEELVLHYLCRKVSRQCLPVPIIPDVDLYRYDPWQLPAMALFGTKEWYFFSPRDRKYPNGLRPNRAAGNGYWKATGADKPVRPRGCATHVGIKKALVFYSGKPPLGIKTNWIMHEYRLAEPNRPSNDKGSLRLDGWVLCRIYNKKNNWEKIEIPHEDDHQPAAFEEVGKSSSSGAVDEDVSVTAESPGNNINIIDQRYRVPKPKQHQGLDGAKPTMLTIKEDKDCWLMNLNSGEVQNNYSLAEFGATLVPELMYQDYCFSTLWSPHSKYLHTNLQ